MKRLKKLIACLIVCLTALSLLPAAVWAAVPSVPDRDNVLTIQYTYDGEALPGAEFDIWRVGEHLTVEGSSALSLSGAFSAYPVEINGLTDAEFQNAAGTLYGYAQLDDLTADYTVVTDGEGKANVTVPAGVYLVMGRALNVTTGRYQTTPQLVVLPHWNDAGGYWDHIPTLVPKAAFQDKSEYLTDLKVIKEWADNGSADARPQSITVHLLCDGALYDTVTLTRDNYWRYAWLDLPLEHTWTVSEEVPAGYTVSIRQEGITFVVTNTKTMPTPTPTPPRDIEQTGLLWWPVPVLAFAGLSLIGLGVVARKRDRDEA